MPLERGGGRRLLVGVVCALALGSAACGGKTKNDGAARVAVTVSPSGSATAAAAAARAPVTTAGPGGNATPSSTNSAGSGSRMETPVAARAMPVMLIVARDFAFAAPASAPAGQTTLSMTNSGQQAHELVVVRLTGGSGEQLEAAYVTPNGTPPPTTGLRVIGALKPGAAGDVTLDLVPGTYGLLCFVAEAQSGKTHAQLGMVKSFVVQ